MQLDLCPKTYAAHLFLRDIKSTAESFKSWDTCMDNKTCKIVAIVGIALGGVFVLWILATLIQCMCMGVSCLSALCCCCCRGAHQNRYVEPPQQPYNNANMYPAHQPIRQMEQTYQPAPQYSGNYENNRYKRDDFEYTGYKPLQF
ncbi:hypothetical protein HF325_004689 [Metschnikowia pulcherrima]|uniref:Uncharacterized protein n=1 Tax=Metschnikowia pulcherrima TaxID=27326 RepID=A0A8H7LAY7_9ASCO|nr:hypothetical protein HF325_004689 [Metschnikowia pulcherrima]